MVFDDEKSHLNYILTSATKCDDLNGVKEAVEWGANINADEGRPLRLAVKYNNLDIVKYLVKMGARIYFPNNYLMGLNAIGLAKHKGHNEIHQFLKLYVKKDKMSQNLVKIMLRDV